MSAWERVLGGGIGGGTLGTQVRQASFPDIDKEISQGIGGVDPRDKELGRTHPPKPDYIPGGTNPGGPLEQFDPTPYPTVLPSLSAAQLGQLAERRRLADERLKRAKTEAERRQGLLEAASVRAREDAARTSKRTLQDFMREAGGKGLARSPMVAGRKVRREGEDLRLKYGEIDTRLSTEIMALQDMVAQASDERNAVIAAIEQERVNMQADLDRLFPAAGMFR